LLAFGEPRYDTALRSINKKAVLSDGLFLLKAQVGVAFRTSPSWLGPPGRGKRSHRHPGGSTACRPQRFGRHAERFPFDSDLRSINKKTVLSDGLFLLKAQVGVEPTHEGFADLSLPTWVLRHVR
jgi:hypothetical protein